MRFFKINSFGDSKRSWTAQISVGSLLVSILLICSLFFIWTLPVGFLFTSLTLPSLYNSRIPQVSIVRAGAWTLHIVVNKRTVKCSSVWNNFHVKVAIFIKKMKNKFGVTFVVYFIQKCWRKCRASDSVSAEWNLTALRFWDKSGNGWKINELYFYTLAVMRVWSMQDWGRRFSQAESRQATRARHNSWYDNFYAFATVRRCPCELWLHGFVLSLYHNCDSTTIRLRHDYDEKLTCSFFARVTASNRVEWKQARAIRRSRIVVVSYSRIAIVITALVKI